MLYLAYSYWLVIGDCCLRVCPLFRVVLHARLPDTPLLSDKPLRLIARIPLIQRREKHRSREEKSVFTWWFFFIYARSLKDQARQSKYPRT